MLYNREYAAYVKRMTDAKRTPLAFNEWRQAYAVAKVAGEEVEKYYGTQRA